MVTLSQNQYVGNVHRGETYLYDQRPWSLVIVGSSMVTEYDRLSERPGVYTLNMAGFSAVPALQLVVAARVRPACVAIEMNSLSTPGGEAIVREVRDSPLRFLKERVLAFRRGYQPVSVLMTLARELFGQRANDRGLNMPSDAFTRSRVQELRAAYETPADDGPLRQNVGQAIAVARRLRDEGVRVTFFELPVPHGLAETPFHRQRRAMTETAIDRSGFEIIRFGDEGFTTTDGIHLPRAQSKDVARRLVDVACPCPPVHAEPKTEVRP